MLNRVVLQPTMPPNVGFASRTDHQENQEVGVKKDSTLHSAASALGRFFIDSTVPSSVIAITL